MAKSLSPRASNAPRDSPTPTSGGRARQSLVEHRREREREQTEQVENWTNLNQAVKLHLVSRRRQEPPGLNERSHAEGPPIESWTVYPGPPLQAANGGGSLRIFSHPHRAGVFPRPEAGQSSKGTCRVIPACQEASTHPSSA